VNSNLEIPTPESFFFFTAETYPSYAGGGRNAFNLARHLTRKNYSCSIVVLNYNNQLLNRECIFGVKIYRIPYFHKFLLLKILSFPVLLINYIKYIHRSTTIFVYGRYLPGSAFIICFAKLLRKKVVYRSTLRGDDDIPGLRRKGFWFFWRFCLKKINGYHAINSHFADQWKQEFGAQPKVLCQPQGVDGRFFNTSVLSQSEKHGEFPVLITNGILVERKGYRKFFEQLSKVSFPFKLIVIGQHKPDSIHKSNLQETKEMHTLYELGKNLLGEKVEFMNTLEDIRPLLANADLFLYAASVDGTPNAVFEAMAVGLPVLMLDAGHNKEIFIEDVTVKYFKSFKELPKQMEELLQNLTWRAELGTSAADSIAKNYTFEILESKLMQLIDS
jgi:glycosyltransferase involved in cell wall biosynthesis